ncbi:MAG: type II secretion system protein [Alphaproteobacteria bacterium]|nr:type II secretion system protein [Alphaproteobacteria bacterium]MBN2675283.1 type II secretion system protein [Alphaproteobacteria bacterium]
MRNESGRSLIEIMGVLAITGILTAGTIATYNNIRNRQARTIATSQLEMIAKNTRLLMSMTGDYTGVSVDYLIKSGALKNTKAPLGSPEWSVTSSTDGNEFLINLVGLSKADCDYFTTKNMEWVSKIEVNGYEIDPGNYCLSTGNNKISFIVQ